MVISRWDIFQHILRVLTGFEVTGLRQHAGFVFHSFIVSIRMWGCWPSPSFPNMGKFLRRRRCCWGNLHSFAWLTFLIIILNLFLKTIPATCEGLGHRLWSRNYVGWSVETQPCAFGPLRCPDWLCDAPALRTQAHARAPAHALQHPASHVSVRDGGCALPNQSWKKGRGLERGDVLYFPLLLHSSKAVKCPLWRLMDSFFIFVLMRMKHWQALYIF